MRGYVHRSVVDHEDPSAFGCEFDACGEKLPVELAVGVAGKTKVIPTAIAQARVPIFYLLGDLPGLFVHA